MQSDSPPTIAQITGLERLAAAAAEQLWKDVEADADRRDREAADFQRRRLIAQGRIKPADPAEIEQARRPRFVGARFN